MAELIELAQRFGAVEVEVEAECTVCGQRVSMVVVGVHDVACGDCGLPVVA